MSAESAEAIALFRYRVIAEAIGQRLSPAERGAIIRTLARQLHEHPDGSQRQYSRGTLDRWLRAYRDQGLDGLKPDPRSDLGAVRRHPELLDEACALRAELPTRSAAQIGAILFARHRIRVAERTIREHLQRRGLQRAALAGQPRAFGRFEASRPGELWIGDVLVGPFVPHPRASGSKRAYLFVLVLWNQKSTGLSPFVFNRSSVDALSDLPPSAASGIKLDLASSRGVGPAGVGTSVRRSSRLSTAVTPSETAARSSSVRRISASIRCKLPLASNN